MAITDLTGTKWKINSITCSAGYAQFDILGTAYDQYGELKMPGGNIDYMYIGYSLNFDTGYYPVANGILINSGPTLLDVGDVLEFDETNAGTDVTNTALINWLLENGTLIPLIENKKNMYVGGNKVSKVMVGGKAVMKILIGDKVIYEE